MRILAVTALLAALAGARPGKDTALRLKPVEPMFAVGIAELPSCPPTFVIELTADMPDAGWDLVVDRVSDPDESGRRVVEITATRREGFFAQVLSPRTAKVCLGSMRKGTHLFDVRLRRIEGSYERVQAVVVRGL
jgi:hypothetical protein